MSRDRLPLTMILESIEKIRAYAGVGEQAFLGSTLVQDAIAKRFEEIGEQVKRLSPALVASSPDIPWSDIARFRDRPSHQYGNTDVSRVWLSVERDLPPLELEVRRLLAVLPAIAR